MSINDLTVEQLAGGHWINYWSEINGSGVATSLLAGIAGGVIVSSRMKVLGTGMMVALALIPSMAIIGMGVASGLADLALGAASRWLAEVLCVLFGGGMIILLKQKLIHRRPGRQDPVQPNEPA